VLASPVLAVPGCREAVNMLVNKLLQCLMSDFSSGGRRMKDVVASMIN
jgi:hypothetical protein